MPDRGEPGPAVEASHRAVREPRASGGIKKPVLEIGNLHVDPAFSEPAIDDLSLSVSEGEILGIAGIVGNGQRLLARAISGRVGARSGKILFSGSDVTAFGVAERLRLGLFRVPEDPTGGGASSGIPALGESFTGPAARGGIPERRNPEIEEVFSGCGGPHPGKFRRRPEGIRSRFEPFGRKPAKGRPRAPVRRPPTAGGPRTAHARTRPSCIRARPLAHRGPRPKRSFSNRDFL